MAVNAPLNRKLRMGLVGGGQGSFIGRVHSIAACLDNRATVVAGALSSDPAKAKASAPDYDITAERAYGSYKEMIDAEKKRTEGDRIDFVSVTTPNHTHFEVAKAAAEAGFNVVCDKPLTFDLAQAEELAKVVQKTGVVFAVTHNYTGYPLVRQARDMVLAGELGEINAIRASYIQGWLRTRLETEGQKQAGWRTDPKKSGAAGCFGDIGTHAYNLGRFITGLIPEQISCSLKVFVPGRALDDYGTAVIRYGNGALGTVTASQISHGRENDIWIEVDGTKASLEWHQEEPNKMLGARQRQAAPDLHTRRRPLPQRDGVECLPPAERPPGGVPRGLRQRVHGRVRGHGQAGEGRKFDGANSLYPNVADGVDGMNFITQSVASSAENGAWRPLKHPLCR